MARVSPPSTPPWCATASSAPTWRLSTLTFLSASTCNTSSISVQRSQAARDWADAQRASELAGGESFVSETVFSHESKLALIDEAPAQGYVVALYVLALDDLQRLLARVQRQVQEGGHFVPPDKILARYPRTLRNLSHAVSLATVAYLYEARDLEDGGPFMVAMCEGARVTTFSDHLPRWTQTLLGMEEVG